MAVTTFIRVLNTQSLMPKLLHEVSRNYSIFSFSLKIYSIYTVTLSIIQHVRNIHNFVTLITYLVSMTPRRTVSLKLT